MKLLENKPYIEFQEVAAAIAKFEQKPVEKVELYLRKANSVGNRMLPSINDTADKRKVLYCYEGMAPKYRQMVEALYGNPADYLAKAPIRALVTKDFKAESFFFTHQLADDKKLPTETAQKYSNEAAWLNMIISSRDNAKKVIKEGLKLSIDQFFTHVRELLETEKKTGRISANFPVSYTRLTEKINEYKATGYASLIDPRFGNQSAAKLTDEISKSLLIAMLAESNQFDCQLIAHQYNKWAAENNYKPITGQTVANKLAEWKPEIEHTRSGREAWNKNSRRKVMRQRPTQPLYLVESDDNHLDWWFTNDQQDYKRIKGIIVTDSFNDYILGYAITDGEMQGTELVRLAYLNAMHHIHDLTGGWYLPFEVKTDQWNIKQLRPFYESIAHYCDTPVGSKNRGWLENFFGHIDWERSLKIGNNNYNGHNIGAKTIGVNKEAVLANRKNWPHICDAEKQMADFVERLRTQPRNYNPANKSRQQEWLEAWAAMPEEKKIPISDEQRLLKFGFAHAPRNGSQNSITSAGVRPTIMGIKYAYSVPPALYMPNNGKQVQVIYDPYDMNRVLITDGEKLRFVASSMTPVAGCMADMHAQGGRALLNQIMQEAKDDSTNALAKAVRRTAVLQDANIDVQDILKRGITVPKQVKQLAEASYQLPLSYTGNDVEEITEEFDVYKALLNR